MNELNIKLLHNYVLLKESSGGENKMSSGFIINPDDRIAYGEIVAVGIGRLLDDGSFSSMDELKVGDKIMYKKGGDTVVNIDNNSYILINDNVIVMILNK
jgi:co-chaperonin GroES (HSP10)